jgi:hypothetical protein
LTGPFLRRGVFSVRRGLFRVRERLTEQSGGRWNPSKGDDVNRIRRLTAANLVTTAGGRRRATTTAVTLTMAGTLGFGLMTPAASAANGPCSTT